MTQFNKRLYWAAKRYIKAKITMTNCMQKHFRQKCNWCNKYDGCRIYRDYVDKWMDLQDVVGKIDVK